MSIQLYQRGVRALPSDEEALEVLKAGFGDTWEFDGKGYLKQIMDKAIGDIKGRLSAYHTEGVD